MLQQGLTELNEIEMRGYYRPRILSMSAMLQSRQTSANDSFARQDDDVRAKARFVAFALVADYQGRARLKIIS